LRSFDAFMITAAGKPLAAESAPTPRRRGSLDQVLIDAAMDLFASYGYRGTSLSRIARAAGVTKGALYWHFSDKEEFFLAVVEKVLGDWEQRYPKAIVTKKDFATAFLWTFENMAALNEKNPWVSRLLLIITLESHKISPRVLRAMRRANLGALRNMRTLVERGKQLGVFDPSLDAGWASTQMFASYLGLANLWYLHGPRFDLRRSLTRQAREFMRQWSSKKARGAPNHAAPE
jgi:AcrR family transcriptional regulator